VLIVLDSSAVLALLNGERGADGVLAALGESIISAVNAAEVLRVLVKKGATPPDGRRVLARLHLQTVEFTGEDLEAVAEITQRAPQLSLGDCACLALGKRMGTEVLTADRAWASVDVEIAVRLIR
jgi:ribonuclease VapC